MISHSGLARYCGHGAVFMVNADNSDSQINIATCPVNWNNNDLVGWRPVTPFPEVLDRIREAGYTATEYDGSFGSDAAVVMKELQARELELTGSYQWVDFLNLGGASGAYDYLRANLAFLKGVDCRNLIVSDPLRPLRVALAGRVPADGSQSLDQASYRRIANGVQELASVALEYGIQVRYHNHVGSWIEAPHELNALLAELDFSLANLCFDTGHYAYGGGNPYAFIRDNIGHIGYLHLKDVDNRILTDAQARELTFLEALREIVFAPIGTGTADIPGILGVLLQHGFKGWIVVEQDTCANDPTEAARENLTFIKQWLNQSNTVRR